MTNQGKIVERNLYKITGTTDEYVRHTILVASRTPIDAINVAGKEFGVWSIETLSLELEQVWTPLS
jgi:hypothetical protein